MDAFLKEHAEALKRIAAKDLDRALRSRDMAQFPMSTFTRLFLEKFEKQLETEQVRALSTWQEHLCVPSAAEQEAIAAKRKKAVLDIQDFLVNFAPEIVQLQKKNLRGVVNCSQAKKHKEWQRARNYFVRQYDSFTFEEKELLEDWELLLCDVSTLESVALLPGLQRCFQRVDAFLKEHAEALKRIAAKDLDRALRSRDMAQFPMSTFTRLFLEKFEKQLETEQVRALSTWQEHLCVPSAAEQEAIAAKRKKAVLDIQDFLVNFAPEIVQLQKKNLRGVVNCSQAKKHKEWQRARNYFVRQYDSFTFEEKIIRRLGAPSLWCVYFGVCGSSARTSEVLPTCGCLLKRTCRSLEKNCCQGFRSGFTKPWHGTIPHVHFYEVILGEVWEATWNRTSKSSVYMATEALRPEGARPWSDAS